MKQDNYLSSYTPMEWTDEKVSRFWDFTSHFPTHYFTYLLGEGLLNFIRSRIKTHNRILDYGSGTGHFLNELLRLGGEVQALEFSPVSLSKINAAFKGRANFLGSILFDEVKNHQDTFDFITCIEVVEHLSDEHLAQTFTNIHALLKPGGLCMITTPNDEELSQNLVYCPHCNHYFHRWQHMRSWDKESLASYAEGKGFKVKEVLETNFASYIPSQHKGLKKLVKLMLTPFRRYMDNRSFKEKNVHLVCIIEKQ
jgi:2-polyprenyl-3-methyl-5-hydroxy-6-metoxy-1,4-benzoquinol methylase